MPATLIFRIYESKGVLEALKRRRYSLLPRRSSSTVGDGVLAAGCLGRAAGITTLLRRLLERSRVCGELNQNVFTFVSLKHLQPTIPEVLDHRTLAWAAGDGGNVRVRSQKVHEKIVMRQGLGHSPVVCMASNSQEPLKRGESLCLIEGERAHR